MLPRRCSYRNKLPEVFQKNNKRHAFCPKQGATVVAITDSLYSPLAKNADHVITARSDMASFVDSLVAPLSVINALIVAIE